MEILSKFINIYIYINKFKKCNSSTPFFSLDGKMKQ